MTHKVAQAAAFKIVDKMKYERSGDIIGYNYNTVQLFKDGSKTIGQNQYNRQDKTKPARRQLLQSLRAMENIVANGMYIDDQFWSKLKTGYCTVRRRSAGCCLDCIHAHSYYVPVSAKVLANDSDDLLDLIQIFKVSKGGAQRVAWHGPSDAPSKLIPELVGEKWNPVSR